MRHSDIAKKFPSYFKSFKFPICACDAPAEPIKCYRACKTRNVDVESFTPSFAENDYRVIGDDKSDPSEYSLSVYGKIKDVKRFAATNGNYNPPYRIALGSTEPCCGIAQETRKWKKTKSKSSHIDWWLYENALPHEHFSIIDIEQHMSSDN